MFALDGSMAFYYPPSWFLLFIIELLTIIIEYNIILITAKWWTDKDKNIDSIKLVFIVTLANIVTAFLGVVFYFALS
jgi:hypothetical protein